MREPYIHQLSDNHLLFVGNNTQKIDVIFRDHVTEKEISSNRKYIINYGGQKIRVKFRYKIVNKDEYEFESDDATSAFRVNEEYIRRGNILEERFSTGFDLIDRIAFVKNRKRGDDYYETKVIIKDNGEITASTIKVR